MQNWQKCFLKQALNFGICVHQKDGDQIYYPYKERFNIKYYTDKIEQLQIQIKQLQSNPQSFKDKYIEQLNNNIDIKKKQKQRLKQEIIRDKEILLMLQKKEVKDNTISIIKSSCIYKLKKRILQNEDDYKNITTDNEQEKFGIWIQKRLQEKKYYLDCTNNMFELYKRRISQQHEKIDELYQFIGLKASDYDMVKIQE